MLHSRRLTVLGLVLLPVVFWPVAKADTAPATSSSTQLKIASVPPEYTPTAGAEVPEPVTMQAFSFQVDSTTGRARVVVEYTYPDMQAFGLAGGRGPRPTMAELPGLRYDPAAKQIVFESAGAKTICANVENRKLLFRSHLAVTPTGACTVTAQLNNHSDDTGWTIRQSRTIDTFFDVR
jgi:hypothetical protein